MLGGIVRLDDHVLVEHRGAQVAGAFAEHLATEEAGRAAVVHDRLLDAAEEIADAGAFDVLQLEAGDLAGAGVNLGEQCDEAAVAVARMRVTELESAPFRVPETGPTLRVPRQRQDIRPADTLLAPADRFGH